MKKREIRQASTKRNPASACGFLAADADLWRFLSSAITFATVPLHDGWKYFLQKGIWFPSFSCGHG